MRIVKSLTGCLLVLFCVTFGTARPGFSETEIQFEEEMFFTAGEWVETASKRLQPIGESPAAVTIITAEEIRNSGATNLCDLLRRVPGLEVIIVNPSDCEIGARGQNKLMSNGVLVLENGRSVYEDYFGVVLWNFKDFSLEMIDRIEVVRGPGSVLYGANAFHAVVNIITRDPSAESGGIVSLTGGPDTILWTLSGSSRAGRAGYLVSAGLTQFSHCDAPEDVSIQYPRAKMSLHYDLDEAGEIQVEAGMVGGEIEVVQEMFGLIEAFIVSPNLMVTYQRDNFYIRAFWNSMKTGRAEVPEPYLEGEQAMGLEITLPEDFEINIDLENHVVDVEAQNIFELPARNFFTLGAGYRLTTNRYTLLAAHDYEEDHLFNVYAQHEFAWERLFHTYLGVRWDHHEITGSSISPRGSILISPMESHVFRFSAGRSFRSPSFVESRMDVMVPVRVGGYPTNVGIVGNDELDPEVLTSFEAGYQASLFEKRLKLEANVFFNQIDGLIGIDVPFELEDALAGELSGSMKNILDEEVWGVEAEVSVRPSSWLTAFANYSWTRVDDLTYEIQDRRTPENKINGGVTAGPYRGLSATVLVHYAGETDWPPGLRSPGIPPNMWFLKYGPAPAYTLVNVRLAYRFFQDRAEVAGYVYNILDDEHYEFPRGEECGIKYTGNVRVSF